MIDEEILFNENVSIMLTLIHKDLLDISNDKSMVLFHDHNCHNLFFIWLHDYLSTEFTHPDNNKQKISLFNLTLNYCQKYEKYESFKNIINKGEILKEFLLKERIYPNLWIPPHSIDLKINLLEIINFTCNEAKHSYFRLSKLREKLKKIFKKNNITINNDKELHEYLEYFMEWISDDKLNYHQTKIIELLGNYFLSINEMLNSKHRENIRNVVNNHRIEVRNSSDTHQKVSPLKKPNNLSEIEEFFWKIKYVRVVNNSRLIDLIPITSPYLQMRE